MRERRTVLARQQRIGGASLGGKGGGFQDCYTWIDYCFRQEEQLPERSFKMMTRVSECRSV